jgi:hypothetical protein
MFTLEVIPFIAANANEDSTIKLRYDGDVRISMSPEEPQQITGINFDVDTSFSTCTSNGEWSIDWTSDFIVMTVAKFGDGGGGDLNVSIKKTPEIMASFMSCMRKWSARYD